MSLSKTEKPTQKKIKDAVKKGQSFKSKDSIIACLILIGVNYVVTFDFVGRLAKVWIYTLEKGFEDPLDEYFFKVFGLALKIIVPFFILCTCCTVLPSLIQTGFAMATKIFKLNFNALNPVNGFKKLFSMRTVKDTVKTLLYLTVFIVVALSLWDDNKVLLLSQRYANLKQILFFWGYLLQQLVTTCLLGMLFIMVLDSVAEYFIYIKELKMDKQEVKRERTDQDGNPEIKSMRRSLHIELLDEQTKRDIEGSKVIVVNPTHIAIGIYFNVDVVPIPFISVIETNQCALAVKKYAREMGIPVLENAALARRIFKTHAKYTFISLDELDAVLRILFMLEQIDMAWISDETVELAEGENESKENEDQNERYL